MESMVLLAIGIVISAIASPFLAIAAMVRASRVKLLEERLSVSERRLVTVDQRLAGLKKRIAELGQQREDRHVEAAEDVSESARSAPESALAAPGPKVIEPPNTAAVEPAPAAQGRTTDKPHPDTPQVKAGAPPKRPPVDKQPPIPPPPSEPKPQFDWERWIGLRGAALLGAVALGLAGLLFFKYSIEQGLISPAMRVVFGTLSGLGSLFASQWLRKRDYTPASEALAGAGVIILYAAFWAAHVLYDLIPMLVAFGLMGLVTATSCLLAVRRNSQVVAVLGLVGGFATPLLLSSGSDRPFGLFGYVLLLDLGLLIVGYKRRWPWLTALSLLGTMLLQALWIGERMEPGRLFLGLGILTVFSALFFFVGQLGAKRAPSAVWLRSQIGALLFPFVFALYFAGRVDLGAHLYPIAMMLALLSAGACWLAREQKAYLLGVGASAASVAVVGVWSVGHVMTRPLAWELTLAGIGLAAIFHLFVEREPERPLEDGPALAAILALGGMFMVSLPEAALSAIAPWPWLVLWAALAVLSYRHARFPGRSWLRLAAGITLGVGLSVLHIAEAPLLPGTPLMLALLLAAPLALLAYASSKRASGQALTAEAASALSIVLVLGLVGLELIGQLSAFQALGFLSLLGSVGALAATRAGSGGWYAAALGATALTHYSWTYFQAEAMLQRPSQLIVAMGVLLAGVVAAAAWPFIAQRRFVTSRVAWYAAALVAPAYFHVLRRLFEWRFGDDYIGIVPVVLGCLTLAAAFRAAKLTAAPAVRKSALVWFAAVTMGFLALAIPLQLDKEWVTIGWALQGLGMIALWKRLDHPGLKYFGLALLAAATVRLVGNPAVLGYHPRGTMRIVNWLLYTYMLPAIALLGSASILRTLELVRLRPRESDIYKSGHPLGAIGAGLSAVAVVFVWINLAIADWFTTGPVLTLSFGDTPAQRLTVSIAWALYALLLLGLGVARHSMGLRWISLSFLLVTIGKVFLYDLGALEDLYRVASLVGLAASLITVSLLYQRFVFRGSPSAAS